MHGVTLLRRGLSLAVTGLMVLSSQAHGMDVTPEPASPAPSASPAAQTISPDRSACIPALAAGSQTVTIDTEGGPREVIVHLPGGSSTERRPAVVAFHGYTSFAVDLEAVSGLSALADEGGFVVAYPQALGDPTEWHFTGYLGYDQRDITMIRSLLSMLVEDACVDPERVVVAGHSMGGGMASDTACRLADQVAGVVLVAALWFEPPCQPAQPVPVVALHALDDPVLPYDGGRIGTNPPGAPEQLPVETAIAGWAAHDGCATGATAADTGDGGALLTWPSCAVPARLYRLPSGGHDWPALASVLIADMATSS